MQGRRQIEMQEKSIEANYLNVLNGLGESEQNIIVEYISKLKHEVFSLKTQNEHLRKKIYKLSRYY